MRVILENAEKLLIKSSLFLVAALLVYVLLQLLCWGIQCCLASGCCTRCTKQFSAVKLNEDDVVEQQHYIYPPPPPQQTPQPPLQHSTLPIRIHKTQEIQQQLYSSSLDNYNIQQYAPSNMHQQNLYKQALQRSLHIQTINTQPKFSETKV